MTWSDEKKAEALTSTHIDCLFSGFIVLSEPLLPERVEVCESSVVTIPVYRYSVDDFVGL